MLENPGASTAVDSPAPEHVDGGLCVAIRLNQTFANELLIWQQIDDVLRCRVELTSRMNEDDVGSCSQTLSQAARTDSSTVPLNGPIRSLLLTWATVKGRLSVRINGHLARQP
jgi:hypothetical protein